MIKVVVEHFVAMLSILAGKVVTRADKEEVTNHITNHLLVQIAISDVLPVRVLQCNDNCQALVQIQVPVQMNSKVEQRPPQKQKN